jgi:small conductance mechanosensitive channel
MIIALLLIPLTHPLILIAAGGALGFVLHWLVGRARARALSRLDAVAPVPVEAASEAQPEAGAEEGGGLLLRSWHAESLQRVLVEWGARGAITVVWLLYFLFLLALLPHARDRFETVRGRLTERVLRFDSWLLDHGLMAVIVLIVTVFLMRFTAALIRAAFTVYETRVVGDASEKLRRRAQTLSTILRGMAQVAIFFVGFMVALQQAGLNITPILASAGIVGIAVGFGAQSLVKDFFSGLMILLEDQFSVGDTIKIGDVSGTVEALTLRATRVRGVDGALTIFPNGAIATVSNFSKDWTRAVLDYEVDYGEDVDRAMKIMLDTARELKEQRPAGEMIDEPTMLGLDKVANGNLTLRLVVKTLPAKHAEIARELRRCIKVAFDREGIKGPVRVEK